MGVVLVLGAIVVGLAFWVEFRFSPPLWVHVVLWPVVTIPLAVAAGTVAVLALWPGSAHRAVAAAAA